MTNRTLMLTGSDLTINAFPWLSAQQIEIAGTSALAIRISYIGETGWASVSSGDYGAHGSKAADEFKEGLYYRHIRKWTDEHSVTCFYFEAFDECWKDQNNETGSENHFGMINLKGEAKYGLWDLVDQGVFDGLTRDGQKIRKSYNGDKDALMEDVLVPPTHY